MVNMLFYNPFSNYIRCIVVCRGYFAKYWLEKGYVLASHCNLFSNDTFLFREILGESKEKISVVNPEEVLAGLICLGKSGWKLRLVKGKVITTMPELVKLLGPNPRVITSKYSLNNR